MALSLRKKSAPYPVYAVRERVLRKRRSDRELYEGGKWRLFGLRSKYDIQHTRKTRDWVIVNGSCVAMTGGRPEFCIAEDDEDEERKDKS